VCVGGGGGGREVATGRGGGGLGSGVWGHGCSSDLEGRRWEARGLAAEGEAALPTGQGKMGGGPVTGGGDAHRVRKGGVARRGGLRTGGTAAGSRRPGWWTRRRRREEEDEARWAMYFWKLDRIPDMKRSFGLSELGLSRLIPTYLLSRNTIHRISPTDSKCISVGVMAV
jgi:hypothetical protein